MEKERKKKRRKEKKRLPRHYSGDDSKTKEERIRVIPAFFVVGVSPSGRQSAHLFVGLLLHAFQALFKDHPVLRLHFSQQLMQHVQGLVTCGGECCGGY
jgi:hypothetical protein